jgi:hypothetical protein
MAEADALTPGRLDSSLKANSPGQLGYPLRVFLIGRAAPFPRARILHENGLVAIGQNVLGLPSSVGFGSWLR